MLINFIILVKNKLIMAYHLDEIIKIISEIQIDNKIDSTVFLNKLKNQTYNNRDYIIRTENVSKIKENMLSDLKNKKFKNGQYVKITKICEKTVEIMNNRTDLLNFNLIGFSGVLTIFPNETSICIHDYKNKINFTWNENEEYIFEME
jgi:hypothetical protein